MESHALRLAHDADRHLLEPLVGVNHSVQQRVVGHLARLHEKVEKAVCVLHRADVGRGRRRGVTTNLLGQKSGPGGGGGEATAGHRSSTWLCLDHVSSAATSTSIADAAPVFIAVVITAGHIDTAAVLIRRRALKVSEEREEMKRKRKRNERVSDRNERRVKAVFVLRVTELAWFAHEPTANPLTQGSTHKPKGCKEYNDVERTVQRNLPS
jgi:hypothetical protein